MLTHRQRLLAVYRGEDVDTLPYSPRLDLWYLANKTCGTLPKQHAHRTQNELARAEGWAIYFREADDLLDPAMQKGYDHRGIGLYHAKEWLADYVLPKDVEVKVMREGGRAGGKVRVEYHTPVGMVWSTTHYDVETQRLGISIPPHLEPLIKTPDDYPAACHLFAHLDVVPNYDRFRRWAAAIGEDGLAVGMGFMGASPIHQIQRDLLDPTLFFFHYSDHQARMCELAEAMTPVFEKTLKIICDGPAEVILWGANYDDMLTWPPYFEREITPWLRKVGSALAASGKRLMCHCDGENLGLMDMIRDSGMHIAESICPAPMTKVTLGEYYRRWSGNLVLEGGIPSTVLLPETSEADFEAYLDELFRAIAPGQRIVVGVADQVPPNAVFSRLQRIGERVAREGRLPLRGGAAAGGAGASAAASVRAGTAPDTAQVTALAAAGTAASGPATGSAAGAHAQHTAQSADFDDVWNDVVGGDHVHIREHVQKLLDRGVPAQEILNRGLIEAIGDVGERMASGEAFIHEVLLAARAMTTAVKLLEPHIGSGAELLRGRVLMGTVAGDMHDIGKNLVVTMLKGVGMEVRDLGINVPRERFCDEVAQWRPDVLALSALLTTTMMEMREVIAELERRGLRERVRVIVGGAPVSESFAEKIGADGFAEGAVQAVTLVKEMVEQRSAQPG
jgi:methylmalonyl-CoA mutase cobalamin-binding domain/chain